MNSAQSRSRLLKHWLKNRCALDPGSIEQVSGDASFRRYFRVLDGGASYIVMDAPPEKEGCQAFIDITHRLENAGLNVPHIYAVDPEQGFLLLHDLGDALYLHHLDERSADAHYADAFEALLKIQAIDPSSLPMYDRTMLLREMALFREWFLDRHLHFDLTQKENEILDEAFSILIECALEQPQVFVHRDYHSRNLLLTPDNNPGILDYQDAVRGPATYDLLSLLRDSYISWPREQVTRWALEYRDRMASGGILDTTPDEKFLRWFDFIGMQRQLKVCGIFARLYHRDGKPGYLPDIPRTFKYLKSASACYPETEPLHGLLRSLDIETRLENLSTP
jgi:aminoglycoside/choline kinase family phosphotransferase